ncbi:angiopoietin-1 [Patella vulgata]|uniref:angiopoietin-1 n=1 Tax=Patella vulgata TaxID=6465 RepID=UPI00217FE755|nr:angiopoietin-1 [Patella vulgata]
MELGCFHLLPMLLLLTSVICNLHSNYLLTRTINELKKCKYATIRQPILEKTTVSLLGCSRLCTSVEECKRFMFDENKKLCSLFRHGEHCFTSDDVHNKVCYIQKSVCNDITCTRCPIGYYGDKCQKVIQDCTDGVNKSVVPEGLGYAFIKPIGSGQVEEVRCDFRYDGWTYIETREENCLELDFNRTFEEYSTGFGNRYGNYWLGLENIYNILQNHGQFLLDFYFTFNNSNVEHCRYSKFDIANRDNLYRITIGEFRGLKGPMVDPLTNGTFNIDGRPFSTFDRDFSNHDCPGRFMAGWWYLDDVVCSQSNVHGRRSENIPEARLHWLDILGEEIYIKNSHIKIKRI